MFEPIRFCRGIIIHEDEYVALRNLSARVSSPSCAKSPSGTMGFGVDSGTPVVLIEPVWYHPNREAGGGISLAPSFFTSLQQFLIVVDAKNKHQGRTRLRLN